MRPPAGLELNITNWNFKRVRVSSRYFGRLFINSVQQLIGFVFVLNYFWNVLGPARQQPARTLVTSTLEANHLPRLFGVGSVALLFSFVRPFVVIIIISDFWVLGPIWNGAALAGALSRERRLAALQRPKLVWLGAGSSLEWLGAGLFPKIYCPKKS